MKVNDLIPSTSGFANLGVDVSSNSRDAFDITSIKPFNHIHMISGVFHDPIMGQSGVLRYNRAAAAFEISVDGGLTFNAIATGAGAVSSIGVIGGANLTGNIDLATQSSGFLAIFDTAGASPINFAVDHLGLSGLWRFPTQGFNGRVVNTISDGNGTTSQGAIQVVGASGIVADLIGQILTITPGNVLPRTFAANYGPATNVTITHNLNTTDVNVFVLDDSSPRVELIPDKLEITDVNTVTISFNVSQSGRIVIIGF